MALVIFRVCCTLSIRFLISRVFAISLTALFRSLILRQELLRQLQKRFLIVLAHLTALINPAAQRRVLRFHKSQQLTTEIVHLSQWNRLHHMMQSGCQQMTCWCWA